MLGYRILEITIMKWSIYWEIVDSLASKQPHNECCSKTVTAVIRRGEHQSTGSNSGRVPSNSRDGSSSVTSQWQQHSEQMMS